MIGLPVMAGLDPATHASPHRMRCGMGGTVTAWVAGSSPAMTRGLRGGRL
jgi:hypothetical protein